MTGNGKKWSDNLDGSYDATGYVDLRGRNLSIIPIKFNRVDGIFDCSHNNLKSLENCPNYISIHLFATHNDLETLEFAPKYVGFWVDFYGDNKLSKSEINKYFRNSRKNMTKSQKIEHNYNMCIYVKSMIEASKSGVVSADVFKIYEKIIKKNKSFFSSYLQ